MKMKKKSPLSQLPAGALFIVDPPEGKICTKPLLLLTYDLMS